MIDGRPDVYCQRDRKRHNANDEDSGECATDQKERFALLLDRPGLGLGVLVDGIVRGLDGRRSHLGIGTGQTGTLGPDVAAVGVLGIGQTDGGRLENRHRRRCQGRSPGQGQLAVLGSINRERHELLEACLHWADLDAGADDEQALRWRMLSGDGIGHLGQHGYRVGTVQRPTEHVGH